MLDLSHDGHAPIVNSGPCVIAWTVATRSLGAGHLRLILRHPLLNVLPVLIVAASLGVGGAFDPRLR